MLNYGDAVAHLHIARRVFDSHQPRFTQLGSVWLPLPHILQIPFVQIYSWWANGIAGVIPSALAYLAACAGLYRLARRWLPWPCAALALCFFATNPNLLYLQTTAMTEPLFLCETIWIALWLVEWRSTLDANPVQARRLVCFIAAALIAAIFTRYDGWVIAMLAWGSIGIVLARRGRLRFSAGAGSRTFWLASVLVVAAPIAWFVYNAAAFGDWLFFLRGPYSAKVIEIRTSAPGFPPHPGWHNPWAALIFFVRAAELDAVAAAWGNFLLTLSVLGTVYAWLTEHRRAFAWALLLWLPVPFYAYSVAFGSVPIFLPEWWPHSYYNLRYGMELLPAFALGVGFAAQLIRAVMLVCKPRHLSGEILTLWLNCAVAFLLAVASLNVLQMLRERPLVYVEGTKNIESRRVYEKEIPAILKALLAQRPGAEILMETSVDPELVALTGIPLRQTINESDLEIYTDALAAPAAHADFVLAFEGDEIDQAVKAHPAGLIAIKRFNAPGQPSATLYVSDAGSAQPPRSRLNKPTCMVVASGLEIT
jgi:hypothetical protein